MRLGKSHSKSAAAEKKAGAGMTTDPREQRGLIIAARSRALRRKGNLWHVPSQQPSHPHYLVNLKAQTCTCLDHQEAGHKCKHIWAAEIVYQREFEFNDDGTVTERAARQRTMRGWPGSLIGFRRRSVGRAIFIIGRILRLVVICEIDLKPVLPSGVASGIFCEFPWTSTLHL